MNCYKTPQQRTELALLLALFVRNINEMRTAFHENQGQHAGQ